MFAVGRSALGPACGIAAVVLLMVLTGTGSDSTLVLGGEIVALTLFVPFLAHVYSVLRPADGAGWLSATVLGAGLVAVTVKLVSVVPDVVARRGALEPEVSDAMSRLAEVAFIVSLPPLGICLGVAAAVVLRTRVLPAWLGYAAAASAPLLIANGFALDSEFGPAFLLFLLWVLLAGIVLLRDAVVGSSASPAVMRST